MLGPHYCPKILIAPKIIEAFIECFYYSSKTTRPKRLNNYFNFIPRIFRIDLADFAASAKATRVLARVYAFIFFASVPKSITNDSSNSSTLIICMMSFFVS